MGCKTNRCSCRKRGIKCSDVMDIPSDGERIGINISTSDSESEAQSESEVNEILFSRNYLK